MKPVRLTQIYPAYSLFGMNLGDTFTYPIKFKLKVKIQNKLSTTVFIDSHEIKDTIQFNLWKK